MKIYMDNAATTQLNSLVLAEMLPYFTNQYGNASSVHAYGREARVAVEEARAKIAAAIGAQPAEIFFTSGGTESDNWAVFGAARANARRGKHVITSAIEHHAVLHTMQALEKEGFEVTYLPVNEEGLVSVTDVENALRPDTVLVSIMAANNEIGTIQPIGEIGALTRARGVLFHTDAVQLAGHEPFNVKEANVDMASISAHKIYGPKGIGALYVRKGVRLQNLMFGGAQEKGRRPGTDNTPAIVGFGKAMELAAAHREEESARLRALRDRLRDGLLQSIPHSRLNGHPEKRLSNNVNVSLRFIEGEALLLSLDLAGISASSGSACTSGSLDPSHVLLAIGLPHEIAHGSLRFTLGPDTTEADVDYTIKALGEIAVRLRNMSPLYEDFLNNRETVNSCEKGEGICTRKK